jgi:hypothetical protein
MLGDVEKLLACFKELGIQLHLEDFSERKRIQKIVCLLDLFGIKLGFNFNWYHYGPYSPDLTKTLFELPERPWRGATQLTRREKERIAAFREFVGSDFESADAMELLGSLFFLDNIGKRANASDEQILTIFREKKPTFSEESILKAWSKRRDLEKLWS